MDERVRAAMEAVPRAPFLPADQRPNAHVDAALPIVHGQTNSQPYTVAIMLELLDVHPGHRVLDVGAGSGWTTALLSHLVGDQGRVIGVERRPGLIGPARMAVQEALGDVANADIRHAEPGILGAPADGPFDRILVSAEARRLPQELVDQLAEAGVMVIPVAGVMRRLERHADQVRDTSHGRFRFVPLVEDVGDDD